MPNYYFFLILFFTLFLSGCTPSVHLRHYTFSLDVPDMGEEQMTTNVAGKPTGIFFADKSCAFNLTISTQTYLQAAQSFFASLRSSDPMALGDYTVLESFVTAHYTILDERVGDARILSCPSGYTYLADFSCISSTYKSHRDTIQTSFDTMTC